MNFIYKPLSLEIPLSVGVATVLVVEHPEIYTDMVETLWVLGNADSSDKLGLMKSGESVPLNKTLCFIESPLTINLNERKLLAKLLEIMKNNAEDQFFEEIQQLNTTIINLLDRISCTEVYPLEMSVDMDIAGLFKLYNLRLAEDDDTLFERLITYIRLTHQILHLDVYVFHGIKAFFTETQFIQLQEVLLQEQVYCLFIESSDWKLQECGRRVIIDKDLCIL